MRPTRACTSASSPGCVWPRRCCCATWPIRWDTEPMADVLVAGAGPTGLMLANWLVKLGVDVIVADGKPGPTRESRALVVQARSMEIYDQLEIGDTVAKAASRA